jgi:hypothetical protein
MTGLAGEGIDMGVDPLILVQGFTVTISTEYLIGVIYADRHCPAANVVVFGFMAINALKVIASHMDINILCREIKTAVQVTMFDSITTAPIKVTASTV